MTGEPDLQPKTYNIVERCGAAHAGLTPEVDAFICSYECTFCPSCTATMSHVCTNCGGELVRRPKRKGTS